MYYLYTAADCPEELIAKHPNHARYTPYGETDEIFLFGESLGDITGTPVAAEDINDFNGGASDEDHMDKLAEEATYIGTAEERIAARTAARIQARIDARIAMRVATRTAIRQADRREIRFNAQQGRKIYDEWVAAQPTDI